MTELALHSLAGGAARHGMGAGRVAQPVRAGLGELHGAGGVVVLQRPAGHLETTLPDGAELRHRKRRIGLRTQDAANQRVSGGRRSRSRPSPRASRWARSASITVSGKALVRGRVPGTVSVQPSA